MPKTLYIIIDGMSESIAIDSSLAQAKTPTIDLIASTGKAGFYTPDIGPYHTEPKTDVVVPTFFGLPVNLNPGRAALELADHGVMPIPGTYCCTLKLFIMPSVTDPDWRNSQPIEEPAKQKIIEWISDVAHQYGAATQRSQATQYGERILIGNCSEKERDFIIDEVSSEFQSRGLHLHVEDCQRIPDDLAHTRDTRSDLVFLGWAKGSLRGAFKYLGARCNPFTRHAGRYYDWETYESDFENWCQPLLENNQGNYSTFVLYTKQSAFASRQNDRKRKIETIEWMDHMTRRVAELLGPGSLVIVLSDHSADLGSYTNPVQHTCHAVSIWGTNDIGGQRSATEHFCEKSIIESENNEPISQEELMHYIDSL